LSDDRWNPTPPGWKPTPAAIPRGRGEEIWSLSHDERVASCELRDDSGVGAGWEVLVRHDDEIILGRRCESEPMARFYANAFKTDYVRGGWTENHGE